MAFTEISQGLSADNTHYTLVFQTRPDLALDLRSGHIINYFEKLALPNKTADRSFV
jgi:hypothetical protein